MDLKQILELLYEVSVKRGLSHPFICGGIPRDRVMGTLAQNFSDIDITTGNPDVGQLAKEFSIELAKVVPHQSKQSTDGHTTIYMKNLKMDFSSNFKIPNIKEILVAKNINPSEMMQEIYSRDFFTNTLLMSLDFRKIKDLTGRGVDDIENKIINTCLDPDTTFKYNTNRIIRILYLSAKLDFDVSPDIIEWVKNNPKYLLQSKPVYNGKNIDKALLKNPKRTINLLNDMDIWDYVPMTKSLQPYFNRKLL